MICASEQSVIVEDDVYDEVRAEFAGAGRVPAQFRREDKVREIILKNGRLNAAIVGQSTATLAELAGITVPEGTRVLIGEVTDIDTDEPFAYEKLSPILAMYRASDFDHAVDHGGGDLVQLWRHGPHLGALHEPGQHEHIQHFEAQMTTARVLINTPSSQGAIGDLYNFKLDPSLTLGCGSWGGNSVSGNVGPQAPVEHQNRDGTAGKHAVVPHSPQGVLQVWLSVHGPAGIQGRSGPLSSPTSPCLTWACAIASPRC
jgi:acetaldehyde dehydrogenase/alcohol dehydrogenase